MSDNKLISCRRELRETQQKLVILQEMLNLPEQKALKTERFKRKRAEKQLEESKRLLKRARASITGLRRIVEPLKDSLKQEKRRVLELAQERAGIIEWLDKHEHKLAPGEPIIEKLDNLETIIHSYAQLVEDGKSYFKKYPELAKTDGCDKAVAWLRKEKADAK